MKPWRSFCCAALTYLCLGAGSTVFSAENETIILKDDFSDGNKDKTGPLDANWRYVQNIKFDMITDSKPGELAPPKYLQIRPLGTYPTFVGVFSMDPGNKNGGGSGLTLGDKEGDQLELLVEFRFTQPATKDTEIRIGLFNNGGTPSQEHTMAPYADDPGYYVALPQSGGTATISKDLGTMGSVAGGSDKVVLRAAQGTPVPPLKNDWHTLSLTLTRDKQGIVLVSKLDGIACGLGIDSPKKDNQMDVEGLYTVFHEIGMTTGAPNTNSLQLRKVLLRGNPKEQAEVTTKLSEPTVVSTTTAGPASSAAVAVGGASNWASFIFGGLGVGVGVGITLLVLRKKGN